MEVGKVQGGESHAVWYLPELFDWATNGQRWRWMARDRGCNQWRPKDWYILFHFPINLDASNLGNHAAIRILYMQYLSERGTTRTCIWLVRIVCVPSPVTTGEGFLPSCPACSGIVWAASTYLGQSPSIVPPDFFMGGAGTASWPVQCAVCAAPAFTLHITLHSAVHMARLIGTSLLTSSSTREPALCSPSRRAESVPT